MVAGMHMRTIAGMILVLAGGMVLALSDPHEPPVVVTGVVVSPAGDPLPGIAVLGARRVFTDAKGRFVAEVRGELIAAHGDGFFGLARVGAGDLVVEAVPTRRVRGVVLDKRGLPVAGASVANAGWVMTHTNRFGEFAVDMAFGAVVVEGQAFPHLERPFMRCMLGGDAAPAAMMPRRRGVQPRPLAPGIVRGRVLDAEGRPLSAVRVTVARPGRRVVTYAVGGSFSAGGLEDVPHMVRASAPGYRAAVQRPVRPGQTVELRLRPMLTMRGRVLDGEGRPVAYLQLVRTPAGRGPSRTHTDRFGRFSLPGQVRGRYRLKSGDTEWETVAGEVALPGEPVTVRVRRRR